MTRPDPQTLSSLADLRAGIDAIDDDIMALLGERMAHVACVVPIKAATGVAAAAPSRAKEVYAKTRARAQAHGVDPDMAEQMWKVLVEAIIAHEQSTLGTQGDDK